MKAIVNATPLIALAVIDRLDLLIKLFDEVIVPTKVYQEVTVQGTNKPGAKKVAELPWLTIMSPEATPGIDPHLFGLDAGETEVLLLAQQIHPDWIIIDERLARRVALAMRLPLKGTLGLLISAADAGLIDKDATITDVRRLSLLGIRISPRLLAWFEDELKKIE